MGFDTERALPTQLPSSEQRGHINPLYNHGWSIPCLWVLHDALSEGLKSMVCGIISAVNVYILAGSDYTDRSGISFSDPRLSVCSPIEDVQTNYGGTFRTSNDAEASTHTYAQKGSSLESPVRSWSRPIWMPMIAASRAGTRRDACAGRAYFTTASPLSACALRSRQRHGLESSLPQKRPGMVGYYVECSVWGTRQCRDADACPHPLARTLNKIVIMYYTVKFSVLYTNELR